jgi:hypothetical protein
MSLRFPLAAALAISLAAGRADAAAIYDWTFTETDQFRSVPAGNFTGTLTLDNGIVTAITGSSSTLGAITGLLAPGVYGNNTLPLTSSGIGFSIGGTWYNLYNAGFTIRIINNAFTVGSIGNFSYTLQVPASVPEPMGLAILGLAIAGLAAARRARH